MVSIHTYNGTIRNGEIQFEQQPENLPEGAKVVVTIVNEQDEETIKGISAAEILNSGLVGVWADRDDIEDSVKFAEEIRRRAERRE